MNRVLAVAVILFCFEIGFFLIVVPWSTLWENNLLFIYAPSMRPFFLNYIVRIAVSALGILDLLIGISEVRRLFRRSPIASTE